ncbi:MAG: cupredoxin domain-containing protein [Betaproteobacteria bacterium]|nr:cupredoxin domain-containing protein [Betaproteobacteria bacterium]MBI2959734.1 cupredoxin domain-containing protein [Betaproteobacteria bacterium]
MNKPSREELKQTRQRRRRLRARTFAVVSVLVLGAAGYLLVNAFWRPEPPPMPGNTIDIAADMGGFNRKVVRVRAGEPVTVRLTSLDNSHHTDGGGKHQWAVDELGVDIIAPPMGSKYKTFTPTKPGTYTFYCDICCGGRANPTMSGKLIVVG